MSEDAAGPTLFATPTEPPRDRPIWIVANILVKDGLGASAEHYEGYAQWKGEGTQDWLDARKMSIRQIFGASMNILEWKELAERATNAPEHETRTNGALYHYGEDDHMPKGLGFYVSLGITHEPTGLRLFDSGLEGPYTTRAEAATALMAIPVPNTPIKEEPYR